MIVWLAMDPESRRITAQAHEFGDGDMPRGMRGQGWKIRQATIPDATWAALLDGQLDDTQQDQAHQDAWNRAGGNWPDD